MTAPSVGWGTAPNPPHVPVPARGGAAGCVFGAVGGSVVGQRGAGSSAIPTD